MTILYSPSNVLCSSDKPERVKQLAKNLTRFHGGFFELEILETCTTTFLLKTITGS